MCSAKDVRTLSKLLSTMIPLYTIVKAKVKEIKLGFGKKVGTQELTGPAGRHMNQYSHCRSKRAALG